jgi:hypothetical protein
MTCEPLYPKLGTPWRNEVLSRLREGRRKALASMRTRFIVSCQEAGAIREVVFLSQPSAQDILETLGQHAIVVSVEIQRAPARARPQMFE